MPPNLEHPRSRVRLLLGAVVVAIVLLVLSIVVLWVLQGQGAFESSEQRREDHVTESYPSRNEGKPDEATSNETIATVDRGDDRHDPNIQFVTPYKISPQPLADPEDILYDQIHNVTTGPPSHHSGHFRHKKAKIWDPHPEYEIVAFGKTLHLNLVHNDDILKNIHITHVYGNYSKTIEHDPRTSRCFYKGTIKGDANSSVSVNLCHGMTGHIHTSTGNYYITPSENSSEAEYSVSTLKHKIVKESYRPDDIPYQENNNISHCDEKIVIDDDFLPEPDDLVSRSERYKRHVHLFDDIQSPEEGHISGSRYRHTKGARTKRTDHEYFIEVLVVADKKMVEYHEDRETLIQYILIIMSHVGVLFKDATVGNPITVVVGRILILNDTEFTHSRSDQMLKNFCEWQREHNVHIHHDVAILLTRDVICKNMSTGICHTLGIAEVGGMCSDSSSCAIVKDNGLSTSYTIAHEMGHLLNMRHDDYHKCAKYNGGVKANIMSKVLQNDTKPWQWSACSRHYLTEFLDSPRASCLLDRPKDVKLEFSKTLPGESFQVNRQCELEFGGGSKICSYMPICSSLWCTFEAGEENGCRTQNMPWADGTQCGYRSWCHHGRCIAKNRQSLMPRNGIWGPWQEWGECSRSCGGGVKMRKRECDQPPPANGGSYCMGQSTSYTSCNSHDCPAGTHDFREDQCAEFDGDTVGIAGLTVDVRWIPKYGITEEEDLCRLFCRVQGTNEYYRLRDKVVDGTKCSINSFDICVNGKCLPGGCDNVLNSTQTLDECGICNGDNSTCQEIHGTYNHNARGYNRVVRIPKDSSNLVIEQRGPYAGVKDDNYLALVDGETGEYILNGGFIISSWKRDLVYGGITLSYSGSVTQIERLVTPKNRKLAKDLVVEVLTVAGQPPDISYRYTINKDMAPKFAWHLYETNWTECNALCSGLQFMRPVCVDLVHSTRVPDTRCADLSMRGLIRERPCNTHCRLDWNKTRSGHCSVHCGRGWQDVNYNCMRLEHQSGRVQAVDDKHCSNLPRPSDQEQCVGPCDATHWQYTPWTECSKTCGGGTKMRTAKCVDARNVTIDDSHCRSRKKWVKAPCNPDRCPVWAYVDWTPCSQPCGKGYRTKKYYCSIDGQVTNEEKCNEQELVVPREECEVMACQWFVGNWTSCSASCGNGIRSREVECRAGTRRVNENLCKDLLMPMNRTSCEELACEVIKERYDIHENEIPDNLNYDYYNYRWETGLWSECSRSCGGGTRSRSVACRNAYRPKNDLHCDATRKPMEQEACNEVECPQWRTGDWTAKCNAFCERHRRVVCFNGTVVPANMCEATTKPQSILKCNPNQCHSEKHRGRFGDENKKNHRFRWKKTAWSPCSNLCGKGTRTRKITCRDALANLTVPDGYCHGQARPKHSRMCQHYSKHKCTFTWVDGAWSKCSTSCGVGWHYRNVTCQRVFTGGIIQEGVLNSQHRCDPNTKPSTAEHCRERNCNDTYAWKPGPWDKCNDICGGKWFSLRKLFCEDHRGRKVPKKLCKGLKRPERKRKCPPVACKSCKQVQERMRTKENKEHILNLHGKSAPVYCYKMDSESPEEYISLQAGKDNFAQYYDHRTTSLGVTTFWKVRLDIAKMRIIANDFTYSHHNGTKLPYGQAGSNYRELNRYLYFVLDLSGTNFRLSDSVRWICTNRDAPEGSQRVDVREGQLAKGTCAPNCGTCTPDPNYGLPVEIT